MFFYMSGHKHVFNIHVKTFPVSENIYSDIILLLFQTI